MMRGDDVLYNRYIPQPDGGFQRVRVEAPPAETQPEQPPQTVSTPPPCAAPPMTPPPCGAERPQRPFALRRLDAGDWLVLAILLLLLVDGDEDDTLSVLLTAAAFILL